MWKMESMILKPFQNEEKCNLFQILEQLILHYYIHKPRFSLHRCIQYKKQRLKNESINIFFQITSQTY